MEANKLATAIQLARTAHAGQVDLSSFPYINHPLRVMQAVEALGETTMIVAVLHDVVEDTPYSLGDIEQAFGPEVSAAIDAISQRPNEKYFDYIKRCGQNHIARLVKLADLHDNMLPSRAAGRKPGFVEKYTAALRILNA